MKSFLLKNNKPIVSWSMVSDNTFFEGDIPIGYDLAISPGNSNIIILDVDVKNNKNGYNYIPFNCKIELDKSFYYDTKSGGRHYFISYTGYKTLMNTSTKYGLDLRIGSKLGNAGGYVKYNHNIDIRNCIHLIKNTSSDLNLWLELLFCGVNNK